MIANPVSNKMRELVLPVAEAMNSGLSSSFKADSVQSSLHIIQPVRFL